MVTLCEKLYKCVKKQFREGSLNEFPRQRVYPGRKVEQVGPIFIDIQKSER